MFRTAAAALMGLAFIATSANAAQVTVSIEGKSPEQIRTDITKAATKVCAIALTDDIFAIYERDDCVHDSANAALAKVSLAPQTAMNDAQTDAKTITR